MSRPPPARRDDSLRRLTDFEAPSSDDVDELGRSRGSQVAPRTSSTSHGLRERGRGRWEQHGQKIIKMVMFTPPKFATSYMTTHGDRVERRGGGGSGTRGRTESDGAEQRPPGRPLLCLRQSAPSAQLERGQVQGSVAARGRAAAVASRRAARARRGGQVIGRRVMGRRVTAPSDRSEPIVARPLLTSKACGARLCRRRGAAVMWRGGTV